MTFYNNDALLDKDEDAIRDAVKIGEGSDKRRRRSFCQLCCKVSELHPSWSQRKVVLAVRYWLGIDTRENLTMARADGWGSLLGRTEVTALACEARPAMVLERIDDILGLDHKEIE